MENQPDKVAKTILPVILAGGSGTRMWPLSRDRHPKQLLALFGEQTLIQQTALRCASLPGVAPPLVVCNENIRFFIAEQLRMAGIEPGAILLEPMGRNTAPAVAAAALCALENHADPILLVLPADHYMGQAQGFAQSVGQGLRLAREGRCVTFGVTPVRPETGYGYIKKGAPITPEGAGAFEIARFVEKPHIELAQQYLESGEYFWNSGMFLFSAKKVLEELDRHQPGVVQCTEVALKEGRRDLDFFRLQAQAFGQCPSISLDYAVMEKTDSGAVVSLDSAWCDLGSWEALYEVGERDEKDNVITGDVVVHDVEESYIHATGRLVAAVGLSGHVVVETPDAVLISPRERTQEVKHLVEHLRKRSRPESACHKKDYRPWGSVETICSQPRFEVKRITVKAGCRMSLQKHKFRAEHWIVVRGTAKAIRGGQDLLLSTNQSTFIAPGVVHRLENPGPGVLELIEVQTGESINEQDITRLEDDYRR